MSEGFANGGHIFGWCRSSITVHIRQCFKVIVDICKIYNRYTKIDPWQEHRLSCDISPLTQEQAVFLRRTLQVSIFRAPEIKEILDSKLILY